jgi:large subunit ribosomal protein L35
MPKVKTHTGAKKRFRITASGKIKRAKCNKNHILTKKNRKRVRQLSNATFVSEVQANTIKRIIPYK